MKLLNREEYILWAEVYKYRIAFGDGAEQARKAVLELRKVLVSNDATTKKIFDDRNDEIKNKVFP